MSGAAEGEQTYQGIYLSICLSYIPLTAPSRASVQGRGGGLRNGSADSEITDLQDTQDESKNEQAKREELSNKFEATILGIKSRMEEESDGHGSRKIHVEADELYLSPPTIFLSMKRTITG